MAMNFDWFTSLSPDVKKALLGGAFDVGGGILSNKAAADQQQNTQDFTSRMTGNQALANFYTGMQGQNLDRSKAALESSQLNPFANHDAQVKQAINKAIFDGSAGVDWTSKVIPGQEDLGPISMAKRNFGPYVNGLMTNDSLAKAEGDFQALRAPLLDKGQLPSLDSTYGQAGTDQMTRLGGISDAATADRTSQRGAAQNALLAAINGQTTPIAGQQSPSTPPAGYEYDQKTGQLKQKGGGFWHKFAKIAAPIAGAAAMFIPGLQPVGAALIGAGTGAASAWGNGQNPLTGAGVGAGMGYAGAKLSPSSPRTPGVPNPQVVSPGMAPFQVNRANPIPLNQSSLNMIPSKVRLG